MFTVTYTDQTGRQCEIGPISTADGAEAVRAAVDSHVIGHSNLTVCEDD